MDLNAGDSLAITDDAENLGVELKLEVGALLSKGKVITNGTSTETIVDLEQS